MNFFKISNKENFVSEIIDYSKKITNKKFLDLKILLPTGSLCNELQNKITKDMETCLLPNIITFSDLEARGEEVFKIPTTKIEVISRLEEKIYLADIISKYEKLNFDLASGLRLAPSLGELFYLIETNDIDFDAIEAIPKIEMAEHWEDILIFLRFAYFSQIELIKTTGKVSRAQYLKRNLEAEYQRLQNNSSEHLILAGIRSINKLIDDFIVRISTLENASIILPPFPSQNKYKGDALAQINNLIEKVGTEPKKLTTREGKSYFNSMITDNTECHYNEISFKEFDNFTDEVKYIANLLSCLNQKGQKIALIVHDQRSREILNIALKKSNIDFRDMFGEDFLKQPCYSFIESIALILCNKFSMLNFYKFISHPYLLNEEVFRMKKIIPRHAKFANNLQELKDLLVGKIDKSAEQYLRKLIDLLETSRGSLSPNFHEILKIIIKIAEQVYPEIWQRNSTERNAIAEILNVSKLLKEIGSIKKFPEILKQFLSGGRIFNGKKISNITLCRVQDAILINYDQIIITNLNEDIYPKALQISPWINYSMQKELGLLDGKLSPSNDLYEFYLLLQNENIIITRSQRISGSSLANKSAFLEKLQYIVPNKIEYPNQSHSAVELIENSNKDFVNTDIFPSKISATDIEVLIKAPYNFYAKKILNLRKIDPISENPTIADYGNFFHEVAEEYTNNDGNVSFIDIAVKKLEITILPEHSKKIWHARLAAISPEFEEFERNRRSETRAIHTEIEGEIKLKLGDHSVTIMSIADRIEVTRDNKLIILDYKTGAVPSRKDVLCGIAPQLLIEAIIASENGFNIGTVDVSNIVYVKIANSSPYIEITEFKLSKEDISIHKQGLIDLLTNYIQNGNYNISRCIQRYDDYKHLSRRA